jgi:molybdopterin converting factor small subunit
MKIKLELFGASRDFSEKNFIEFNLKEKSSIKELRQEILKFIDNNFKGNKNYKKLISSSTFCSENNNIVHDDFKINKEQKIGIIPPIGGG